MDTKKDPYKTPDEIPMKEKKFFPGRIDANKSDAQNAVTTDYETKTDLSGGHLGLDKGNGSKSMYY